MDFLGGVVITLIVLAAIGYWVVLQMMNTR